MTTWMGLLMTLFLTTFAATPILSSHEDDRPQALNVDIWDYCDPASFNAALGSDTACVRDTSTGAITFPGFSAELAAEKSVGAWRFAPGAFNSEEGINFTLRSLGGETHTFTRVKKFGGGFVPFLNAASGNPDPAPECAQLVDGNLVPQPPSANNIFVPAGATVPGPQLREDEDAKFQCCIHPWMRATVRASHKHGEGR
jgi:hypothetical protein